MPAAYKNPLQHIMLQGTSYQLLAVPPRLNRPKPEPLIYDDNGITGLLYSRSEVVFSRFRDKKLSASDFSLFHHIPNLLVSSTRLQYVTIISFPASLSTWGRSIFKNTTSQIKKTLSPSASFSQAQKIHAPYN